MKTKVQFVDINVNSVKKLFSVKKVFADTFVKPTKGKSRKKRVLFMNVDSVIKNMNDGTFCGGMCVWFMKLSR